MSGRQRKSGNPYDVGFARPPKLTRFEKGVSGNPYGRPRKKPDLFTDLTRVLNEKVTVTVEGEPQRVTVQQALLMRLRDQALQGEVWASKLVQKVIDALPDQPDDYDRIEWEVSKFHLNALLNLMFERPRRDNEGQELEQSGESDDE